MKWQDFDYNKWKEEDAKYDHKQLEDDTSSCWESSKDLDEFLDNFFKIRLGKEDPPFRPNASYNKDGDILQVTLSEEQYYGHWVCPSITVLLSFETNEVIGVEIWGLKNILKKEQFKLIEDAS